MVAQMDLANRALCHSLRNPPKGQPKTKLKDIRKLVKKQDGRRPSLGAIAEAASEFLQKKGKRGRAKGWRKTTKAEDRQVMTTFHKLRPPGHGVDARTIHTALPMKLMKKITQKTIIRRLGDKGYKAEEKIQKSDPGPTLMKKRIAFAKKHKGKTAATWKTELQAVADLKEFTYYPKELKPKFTKLRAPWTYMTKAEKQLPAFARPKRWFPRKDYKKTKKQKVFGMTTSNGKKLAFLVPKPWSTEKWAVAVKNRVAPFLKKSFPRLSTFQILLDGEKILHGPAAKDAMKKAGIKTLPGWPKYSPDLNPQEHVWAWAEPRLRKLEKNNDTFEQFKKRTLKATTDYPSAEKLIGSMAKRCKMVSDRKGGMLPK